MWLVTDFAIAQQAQATTMTHPSTTTWHCIQNSSNFNQWPQKLNSKIKSTRLQSSSQQNVYHYYSYIWLMNHWHNHGVRYDTKCRDDPEKKMAATLKVHKWHARNISVRLVKASISHIRHYRVLPWATAPLPLLESIAKVPDGQVTEKGKIVCLLSFFVSASLTHASTPW